MREESLLASLYASLVDMLGSLPPSYMPPWVPWVGVQPPVHAVYMPCTGPVLVDGLLGCAVLNGGLYLRGSLPRKVEKEAKRRVLVSFC